MRKEIFALQDEDWASYGDALRVLADKAYSDLEEKAHERLALTQFLAHIGNPQVAFGVRQKRPETVEAAVVATIDLESYLNSCSSRVQGGATPVASAATSNSTESISEALQQLNERLDKLEVLVETDMLELWEERAHSSEVLESSKATGSGKLQTLGGMGLPRGGGYVKAQELQEVTVTVPTLSVSSVASFSVHGMIGSIPLELLVDTGAAVSLLNASVWKGINNTETRIVLQQWSGKKLVGVNGTPLSVKGCVHTCVLIGGGTEFEGSFVVSDGLVVDAIVGLD
eukprot:Em0019g530a